MYQSMLHADAATYNDNVAGASGEHGLQAAFRDGHRGQVIHSHQPGVHLGVA